METWITNIYLTLLCTPFIKIRCNTMAACSAFDWIRNYSRHRQKILVCASETWIENVERRRTVILGFSYFEFCCLFLPISNDVQSCQWSHFFEFFHSSSFSFLLASLTTLPYCAILLQVGKMDFPSLTLVCADYSYVLLLCQFHCEYFYSSFQCSPFVNAFSL